MAKIKDLESVSTVPTKIFEKTSETDYIEPEKSRYYIGVVQLVFRSSEGKEPIYATDDIVEWLNSELGVISGSLGKKYKIKLNLTLEEI